MGWGGGGKNGIHMPPGFSFWLVKSTDGARPPEEEKNPTSTPGGLHNCIVHYDCFHTRAKCVIWIWIRKAYFELKFKRRYFGPCVRQITSRCIIWNAHFKWWSGGVFQLRISQITQRNHRMNALTSKLWFGGGAKWPSNHFCLQNTARCICTETQEMRAPCMFDWQGTQTFFSRSGMLNPKFGLSCVHCVIQISQLLLSCVHCVIQIAHFAVVWKQSTSNLTVLKM